MTEYLMCMACACSKHHIAVILELCTVAVGCPLIPNTFLFGVKVHLCRHWRWQGYAGIGGGKAVLPYIHACNWCKAPKYIKWNSLASSNASMGELRC